MKPLTRFLTGALMVCFASQASSQTITVIQTPGYQYGGSPVSFNGKLFFKCLNSAVGSLASWNDTVINIVPSVAPGDVGYTGKAIEFNGSLFFRYQNSAGKFQIAKWNDTTITLFANSSISDYGLAEDPFIFNNTVYFRYFTGSSNNLKSQWAYLSGNTVVLIPNLNANDPGVQSPVVFQGNLYFKYQTAGSTFTESVMKYNGVNYSTIFTTPSTGTALLDKPVVMNNILYWVYTNGAYNFIKWDGSNLGLCKGSTRFYDDSLTVYHNRIYYRTRTASTNYSIGVIDGDTAFLIPPYLYNAPGFNHPIIFKDTLYYNFPIDNTASDFKLLKVYDGGHQFVSNPGSSMLYWDSEPLVYGEYLVGHWGNQLGLYNGSQVQLINHPAGYVAGPNNGYTDDPILYRNKLYFGYTISGTNYLAYLSSLPFPVTLVSFAAVLNGEKQADISWQVSRENNLQGYEVQRSSDARQFDKIGYVSATQQSAYVFTDKNVQAGLNYYRLKMMDKDGKYSYSSVVKLNREKTNTLSLYPNPVKDHVNLRFPALQSAGILKVYNASGSLLHQRNLSNGTSAAIIDAYSYLSGQYYVEISAGNKLLYKGRFNKM